MSNPTDQIPVLRLHLEEIFRALDTAHKCHIADDLTRQYKNIGAAYQPSNLTKALAKALGHTEGYLLEEYEDNPVDLPGQGMM